MVKYDPEFIAAKKKPKRTEVEKQVEEDLNPDLSWQQLLSKSRHVSTTFCEDFRGMSVFQPKPFVFFTSSGETCHTHARTASRGTLWPHFSLTEGIRLPFAPLCH